jgi:amidase
MNLADLPASEIVRRTTSGDVTALEVIESSLARIESRNPSLNAFSVVLVDEARAAARALDEKRAAGEQLGPLHGVPIAIKDEFDVAGCVTTFGGRANVTPVTRDGEAVRRLRAAGAVIVGKTRMPEFGQWPFTESVAGGITRNPWDRGHTPGGSSGGTAAAVAAGMVPIAIGGDGGGSIRIPAAYCGLFGLKPTRGRVTSDPVPHLWWGLGTSGPLTRTVLDSAIAYDVIRGNVASDRYTAAEPPLTFIAAAGADAARLRIGWSVVPVTKGVKPAPEHVRAVQETARLLADLGHDVSEIDPAYPDPTAAFIPQFLAGVRTEADAMEHYEDLEPRTRQTYRLGAWVTPKILDKALAAGERISERANRIFAPAIGEERPGRGGGIDVLLSPTVGPRPRRVGALNRGGTLTMAVRSRPVVAWTALWNVTGNPAASVPTGTGADGLPVAVQLVGRVGEETTLLSLSAQLERARGWPLLTDPED